MIKPIVLGIVGGLLGAFTDSFIKTYKKVKEDITPVPKNDTVVAADLYTEVASDDVYQRVSNMVDAELSTDSLDYDESDDLDFDDMESDENQSGLDYKKLVHMYGLDIATEYYHIVKLMEENIYEELEDLRHDINSDAALEQYKAMRLSEIQESDWRVALFRLFNIRFTPSSEMDDNLRIHAMEEREQFFGMDSIWYSEVTIAEVILHFAELMSLDFGESVDYYAEELVRNCGFTGNMPLSELTKFASLLENHDLYTENGFGMFGLRPSQQVGIGPSFFEQYNKSSYFSSFDEELY